MMVQTPARLDEGVGVSSTSSIWIANPRFFAINFFSQNFQQEKKSRRDFFSSKIIPILSNCSIRHGNGVWD
jgi:hypothetical protein